MKFKPSMKKRREKNSRNFYERNKSPNIGGHVEIRGKHF